MPEAATQAEIVDPHVFISYRQADSSPFVTHLETILTGRLPAATVFRDRTAFRAGDQWPVVLSEALAKAQAMLVVIGPQWAEIRDVKTGVRRLDAPDDVVRLEIETALRRQITLIPVLCPGASFPDPRNLPESIRGIGAYQAHAVSVRPDGVHDDLAGLVKTLGHKLKVRVPEQPSTENIKIVERLTQELDRLREDDKKVERPEAYWNWLLAAREVIRSAAKGTEVEDNLKHLELQLKDIQTESDPVNRELSVLEALHTLDAIRNRFKTSEVLAEERRRQAAEPKQFATMIPGVPLEKFQIQGSWIMTITIPQNPVITLRFDVDAQWRVRGTLSTKARQRTLDGRCGVRLWEPPHPERYVGGPPQQVIAMVLDVLYDKSESAQDLVPIGEEFGGGYRTMNEDGSVYFLERVTGR